jgi:hypothetical protein
MLPFLLLLAAYAVFVRLVLALFSINSLEDD